MKTPRLTRRELLASAGAASAAALTSAPGYAAAEGPFSADWQSLASGYRHPEWFRDAKLGIWAHWGPQCQPEWGDWYARALYQQGRNPWDQGETAYENH